MTPIAILASGRGSNYLAIQKAIEEKHLHARITAVLSDRVEAPVLEHARAAGVPSIWVDPKSAGSRDEHERRILKELQADPPRFLVLAGYMRILGAPLMEAFQDERGYCRITNIHPSLLPAFPGMDSYQQAFQYGVKWTGATVHLIDESVDTGPICAQEAFSIADCRAYEEVLRRGLEVEHRLYPRTLEWVLKEKFEIEKREGGRICVFPN